MKDIHTHILYDIDDGAKTLEESLDILKKASLNGVTDIVLTPHYIKDSKYSANNNEKEEKLNILKQELKKNNIDINLYLGNEVYIDEDINTLLKKDISTINNSRYILIELPLNSKPLFLDEVLYGIVKEGLIPIIAHPERYKAYYKNYDFFDNLIKKGCLFQSNIGSLYGDYGRKSKKMFKELLKRNMIHFIGSDIHTKNSKTYEKNIEKDLFKIVKDKEKVENLLINNTDKVINNKDIIRSEGNE